MSMAEVLDVSRLQVAPRSLHELSRLRVILTEAGADGLLGGPQRGHSLLTAWTGAASRHGEILCSLAEQLGADDQRGVMALVEGLPGAGKTHLLLCLAAFAEFPAARDSLAGLWGFDSVVGAALASLPRFLVIPVPLSDYAGPTEPLEEIMFAAAEREAARPPLNLDVPLSAVSYTLKVASQHLLPRCLQELDAEARARGFADWQNLVHTSPRLAAALAQSAAAELGLPTPLVPSRSERLASLLHSLPPDRPVLWLLDDLHEFLAAAGPKGAREDIAFLEFLAQRSKVSPVSVIWTGGRSLSDTALQLRENVAHLAETAYLLAPEDLRPLLRLAWVGSAEQREETAREAAAQYAKLWPSAAPSASQVCLSFPWHPLALRVLEQAGSRSAQLANFALRCLHNQPELVKDRKSSDVITLAEAAGCLLKAVPAGLPAERVQEVMDYYTQRAGELWPKNPAVVSEVVMCLLAGQLAGEVLSPEDISQGLGIGPRGRPRLGLREAERLLEAMSHDSPYLRQVRVNRKTAYVVVWRVPAEEQARRELERIRVAIAPSDRRLEDAAARLLTSNRSPFADLAGGVVVEVSWCNAPRFVWVEISDPRLLGEAQLLDLCHRVVSTDSPESAALLIGLPFHQRRQIEAWRRLCETLGSRAGSEGLTLWVPREMTREEMEPLRTLVACAQAEEIMTPLGPEMAAHVRQERMLAEAAALSALTAAYLQGQVLSARGIDLDTRSLGRAAEDVAGAMAMAVEEALRRVHSEFPRFAPRRPLLSREPVEMVYQRLVQPAAAEVEAGSQLEVWAEALLGPLGFLSKQDNRLEITARGSVLVRLLMDMLRARDTAPPHEMGRAVDCAETARTVFKSSLGLPPELFELAVAVLARLGYVVALDAEHKPLVVQGVPPPFAARVRYIARAPALGPTRWQAIGRLLRAIGLQGTIAGDYEGQQRAWDVLVAARHEWLALINDIRQRIDALWEALAQGPEQWPETLEDLDAAEHLFQLVNPAMPAPLGLVALADAICELVERETSFGALANFLSRLRALAQFLQEQAAEVVGVFRYLSHPKLNAPPSSDVGIRRNQLLEFIGSGEQMVHDFMTFRRLQQVFFVTYARRYISWHTRCYQSESFERYAAVLNSPEFRALERLARLQINVEHDAAGVRREVEEGLARRCTYAGLDRSLRISPVCPECGLELGYDPDLPDPTDLVEMVNQGLREYTQLLCAPELREQLRKYMAALPRWGDLSARLLELLNLSGTLSPRQVLTLFTDEVILHLNRVLAGQIIVPKDLSELRRALHGKTLSPEEARRIVLEWLEGATENGDERGGELYEFGE
jgi:hypothetical protein